MQEKGGAVNTQVMALLQNVCMQLVGNRRPGIGVADCPLELLTPQFKRSRSLGGALALEDRPRDSPSPGPGPETPEKSTHPEEEVQEEQKQEVEEGEKPLQHGLTLEESRKRILLGLGFNPDKAKVKRAHGVE